MTRHYGRFAVKAPALPPDSLPSPLDNPDRAPAERRLLCRRYNACLSHAADRGWASFGCSGCPVNEPLSLAEQRDDLDGLASFLRALSVGG